MEEKLNRFKQLVIQLTDLGRASAVLGWDQQVNMPKGGAEDRGNILATMAGLTHEMFTSDEMGKLLVELKPYAEKMDPESDDACLILRVAHDFDKQTKVPTEKVAEFAKVSAMAEPAWEHAREEDKFEIFQPMLEKLVELRREYADCFKPFDHVYDPLLDDFEPGLKTAEVQEIFGKLRPQQVELLKAIAAKPQVDDSFLHIPYSEQGQWDFGVDVATRFGFDWNRGRQDKSIHPFTTSFGIGDDWLHVINVVFAFHPLDLVSAQQRVVDAFDDCWHRIHWVQRLVRIHLAGEVGVACDLPA